VVLVGCTTAEQSLDTGPLALPETIETSTTTILSAATSTTQTTTESLNALHRIDRTTLEMLSGSEALSMGDWAWGISSANGSWLALQVGNEGDDVEEMHLIDVGNWSDASWGPFSDTLLAVGDDGTVYTARRGGVNLNRWTAEGIGPEIEGVLPASFYPNSTRVDDQRILVEGVISLSATDNMISIYNADLADGTGASIDLPEVKVGMTEPVAVSEDFVAGVYASPAVVWDLARDRVGGSRRGGHRYRGRPDLWRNERTLLRRRDLDASSALRMADPSSDGKGRHGRNPAHSSVNRRWKNPFRVNDRGRRRGLGRHLDGHHHPYRHCPDRH